MTTPWTFTPMRQFDYDVIVVDPPWRFVTYSEKRTERMPQRHYRCRDIDWIKALPVRLLARDPCLLFLWATNPMLPLQYEVLCAWGFRYKTALCWRKLTKNGKPRMGIGYVARSLHECVLVGGIGSTRTIQSHPLPSLFDGEARENSRKPDEFYDLLWRATPHARRCDLFSRETRLGFEGWGDQLGKFDAERVCRRHDA